MSSTNRRDKTAALPAEQANSGSIPTVQPESVMSSEQDVVEPKGPGNAVAHSFGTYTDVMSPEMSHLEVVSVPSSLASSSTQRAPSTFSDNARVDANIARDSLLTTSAIRTSTTSSREAATAAHSAHYPIASSSDAQAAEPSAADGYEVAIARIHGEDTIDQQEPNGLDNTSAVVSRKRSKAPADEPRKRSKHLVSAHDEPAQDTGEGGGLEGKAMADNDVVGEEQEEQADQVLPYRSFKPIKLPKRSNQDASKLYDRQPKAEAPSTWYGTMSYEDSIITFLCDEEGLSYQDTVKRFKKVFPNGLSVEMIRKRHIAALDKQLQEYGLKDPEDVPVATEAEERRGKKRGAKKEKASSNTNANNNQINQAVQGKGQASSAPTTAETAQGTIEAAQGPARLSLDGAQPRFVRDAPFRQLEMTAIVVCRDLFGMEFPEIRDLLNIRFRWSLSPSKIIQYYHFARPAAYGSLEFGYRNIEDFPEQGELDEKKRIEAVANILVGLSRGGAMGEQQVVKNPQTNSKAGDGQEATGPGNVDSANSNATQTYHEREVDVGKALLQLRAQPVEKDMTAKSREATIARHHDYDNKDPTGTRDLSA
ncbi:uncharacterized protein N0V89_009604 [Didymosphaeria variabile]|uniref:Uncharacterized protein n=1 Tax=Didymosphaeria variabile TaxID=1932322 RepID=A0A9W8XDT9_9PLEO|nr:uncharacterized protein N0V89_009604 [Didymosphaeria variabile]KAJ4348232.1 hypothetical protein N0V89_009604 [Didymosphaeria variabile]